MSRVEKKLIYLVRINYTQNSVSDNVESERLRPVYATIKSITRSEYYAALAEGTTLECTAVIRAKEYQGEHYAIIDGKELSIKRRYQTPGSSFMELVCEGGVRE